MLSDAERLREYVRSGSEEAFREIVQQHAAMVHGAALRRTGNDVLAEEITQAVFTLLARKASALSNHTSLAGWLHRTTRFVAMEALRQERRHQARLDELTRMSDSDSASATWEQIAPELDEALHRLGDSDREALVLRFLEQRSFAEVARAMNTSEAAAKMRVGRALDKLRTALTRLGLPVPAAALLAALTHSPANAAPAALISSVTAAVLGHAAAVPPCVPLLANGAITLMNWNKLKLAGITLGLLFLAGTAGGLWQWRAQSRPSTTKESSQPTLRTFEPMAGEWEGVMTLRRNDAVVFSNTPCSLSVNTSGGGRVCEIQMVLLVPGGRPMIQHYSHALNERGDGIFTTSDPASGRGDGDGVVTESFHDPAKSEWRAAMRFPLANDRGVMQGRWERQGDALLIQSHDQFFEAEATNHVHADIRLKRKASNPSAK
jgi:RNA polymerase sigma factor (sigma-70 family)